MDPMFNEVTTNTLESVGGRNKKMTKMKSTSVTYPQKRYLGTEKKVTPDPTTSPKRITRKSGAKKYINVKSIIKK